MLCESIKPHALIFLVCLAPCSVQASEQVIIDIREVTTDPLIDFTPPAVGSGDRATVTVAGLRIQQVAERKGMPAPTDTGFKVLLSARGDFTARLNLQVKMLEEPKQGWGQGLLFSVALDDAEQSVLQFGILSAPNKGIRLRAERIGRHVAKPDIRYFDYSFKEGTIEIARIGEEAIFSVQHLGEEIEELARLTCSTADVRHASVWCLRQEQGNTRADFLLSDLTVRADQFFAFQSSSSARWTWWHFFIGAQVLIASVLLIYCVRKNMSSVT